MSRNPLGPRLLELTADFLVALTATVIVAFLLAFVLYWLALR